jgi:threonine aldolase
MDEQDRPIDLRSDTVTRPGPEMRRAMAEAEVGDDVFGDDPTVQKLERTVAEILGKEAALFCPSGTMVNQIAINIQTEPGTSILCEQDAHLLYYECGSPAALSGVLVLTIKGHNGTISAEQVRPRIRSGDIHQATTRLVCIENTHNRAGGRVVPLESMKLLWDLCRERGINVHLDGARLWNASVATGVPLRTFAQYSDTINVCLSKGLGAPAGSLLVSTQANIEKARWVRKRFGGGMRQVGILAAAGLYALEHHLDRLAEDHANARTLAEGLTGIDGLDIDPSATETNIVVFHLSESIGMNAVEFLEVLRHYGVLMVPFGERVVRAVTHLDVTAGDVGRAVEAVRTVMATTS